MDGFPNLITVLRQALAEAPGNEALRAQLARLERGAAIPTGLLDGPVRGLRLVQGGSGVDGAPLAASS